MAYQEGQLDYDWFPPGTVITGRVEESQGPSVWEKIGSALGSVLGGAAEVARLAGPTILKGLASSDFASGQSNNYRGLSSLDLPAANYRALKLPDIPQVKQRALPAAQNSPRLMEAYGRTLNLLHKRYEQQLHDLMELNHEAANRSSAAQAFTQHYSLPKSSENRRQNSQHETVQPIPNHSSMLTNSEYGQASSLPPVAETVDSGTHIQFARKPLSYTQLFNQQQAQPIAKDVLYHLAAIKSAESSPVHLPKAEYNDRYEGKVDLWKKMQNSQVLTDAEMKQLFHAIDMQELGSKNTKAKLEAELARLHAEEQLARNMVASAERDTNGNVLLYGVPIRSEDALYFAKQDIQHFQDTDRHLSPDQIEALKSMPGRYKSTGKHWDNKPPIRQNLTERLRQARTTGGNFKSVVRVLAQAEKQLARQFPNNPAFWRGRLANYAAKIKSGLGYNSNDVPLSYAGHALDKHGRRNLPNSVFPEPKRTNREKNRLGQEIVEDILFDEATQVIKHSNFPKGRYPNVIEMIDIISDFGRGAGIRYNVTKTGNIEFNTFLEP